MTRDLDKLAEELEKETESLRESEKADSDVSADAPVPHELSQEQASLEEQLKTPLHKLEELSES